MTKSNVSPSCDFESRWWCWASHYAPDCHHLPSSYKQHQSLQNGKFLPSCFFPGKEILLSESYLMVIKNVSFRAVRWGWMWILKNGKKRWYNEHFRPNHFLNIKLKYKNVHHRKYWKREQPQQKVSGMLCCELFISMATVKEYFIFLIIKFQTVGIIHNLWGNS